MYFQELNFVGRFYRLIVPKILQSDEKVMDFNHEVEIFLEKSWVIQPTNIFQTTRFFLDLLV